jgi:phosphoethanolamine N-methyltransferase
MPHAADSYDSFQAFLDGSQYTEEGIRRYEFIFGKTYVSTGGQATTQEFVKKLNLKPTDKVLDVGCGIGGSAFHMAREYGVTVHGVDLSTNMINMAIKYQGEMEDAVRKNVSFEMRDITKANFEENSFDVVYSRDTILHIGDKEALFAQFYKWLKPGGKLMISDYCHGDKEEYSSEYTTYVHQRGYHMLKVVDYGHLLETVGFTKVDAQDMTSTFIEILNTEVKRFVSQKEEFLTRFTLQDFEYILEGWSAKVRRCSAGDQGWGLFIAEKPL